MSVKIRKVYIENFRSIQNLSLSPSLFTVFVGKNDCGKSNILRALNLFFNGVTNPNKEFSFEEDYNFFAPERKKVAKEIVVSLELDIPGSYQKKNGQIIVWEKRWRADGLHSNKYWGLNHSPKKRGGEKTTTLEIPSKSNVHTLLRQIEFQYVPAIKDAHYFDELRGRIYKIISQVAAKTFHDSSTAFEESIADHLKELTHSITTGLKFDTKLALPRDLSHIFERLDFLSGDKLISLDNRGDGIKARHIPMILEFMMNKKRSLQGWRGAIPHSFIWAYEEPENNLEFGNAIQLGDDLSRLSKDGSVQIFLTTHSPVFYDLTGKDQSNLGRIYVSKETDNSGTQISNSASEIDEQMGTLAFLAPKVSEAIQKARAQLEAQHEAEQLIKKNQRAIFVEGETDKIVLQRCLEVFFPDSLGQVTIETKAYGAGVNYVIDMLRGWRVTHKHYPDKPLAAGILDYDAKNRKDKWNKVNSNIRSAKCFCYSTPNYAAKARAAGFNLPITLEVLYGQDVWNWAKEKRLLEARPLSKIYPAELIDGILRNPESNQTIDPTYNIYIMYDFTPKGKLKAAKYVVELGEAKFREQFADLEKTLAEVLDYLGVVHSGSSSS